MIEYKIQEEIKSFCKSSRTEDQLIEFFSLLVDGKHIEEYHLKNEENFISVTVYKESSSIYFYVKKKEKHQTS